MSQSRSPVSEGDRVQWSWGEGTGEGEIRKIYTEEVTLEIKGSKITRDASHEKPAYLIVQDDGDRVLKSSTEIENA